MILPSFDSDGQEKQLDTLRSVITENIRVQGGGAEPVQYVDIANALSKANSKQNHVIFGRRGCGKSLLLYESKRTLPDDIKAVYLNCEDFKNHSFPNVLIEILDSIFRELEKHVHGWFGRKKRCKEVIVSIRKRLGALKEGPDEQTNKVKQSFAEDSSNSLTAGASVLDKQINLSDGQQIN